MSESEYPYIIELRGAALWFTIGMWTILGAAAFASLWLFAHPDPLQLIGMGVAIAAAVGFVCVCACRDRKVFHEDSIEFVTLFGAKLIPIAELAGYRTGHSPYVPLAVVYELIPLDPEGAKRKLAVIPGVIPEIDAWLRKLRDLGPIT